MKEIFQMKNKNASWLNMSSFNNFRTLVGILFVPTFLFRFKEEIILETPVLSVGVSKNDLIFNGGK